MTPYATESRIPDPVPFGRKPPLDPEKMTSLAREGKWEHLLDEFRNARSSLHDGRVIQRALLAALTNAARQDPQRFADTLQQNSLAFVAHIILRLQMVVERFLERTQDREPDALFIRDEVFECVVKPVAEMSRLASEMTRSMAATQRLRVLAERGARRLSSKRKSRPEKDTPPAGYPLGGRFSNRFDLLNQPAKE